jgi:hypothetical protein
MNKTTQILGIIALLLVGAVAIPVLVGIISSAPDVVRYLRMRQM